MTTKKNNPTTPAILGRPSGYNDTIADAICEGMSIGKSIASICEQPGFPSPSTVYRWLADDAHRVFRENYIRAREQQADFYAEQIIAIADDGANDTYLDEEGNKRTDQDVVARSRLRVEARKWVASKFAPKKYGEKIDVEHAGSVEITQITRKIIKAP